MQHEVGFGLNVGGTEFSVNSNYFGVCVNVYEISIFGVMRF